ncbi:MAG: CsbD family protein [Spirochaetaceae bacterium]
MNKDFLKGSWDQIKGRIKSEWGKLTDDDLTRANGDMEELVGIVRKRYGYEEPEARSKVDVWLSKAEDKIRSLDHSKGEKS